MLKIALIFSIFLLIPSNFIFAEEIPHWIQNTALWWSENNISDLEFINALEFLINNEIISITYGNISNVEKQETIPLWIKNNAKWWSEGQIDDKIFFQGIEYLVQSGIIQVNLPQEKIVEFIGYSPLFSQFAYDKDFVNFQGEMRAFKVYLKLKYDMNEIYEKIGFFNEKSNAVVIIPLFTATAYLEPGFYTFYRNECGVECLTKKIEFEIEFEKQFNDNSSMEGIKVLELLNYHILSDYDVANNPKILSEYEKIILLHNEYVTKEMFDAITSHQKVVYLYPNALYAEIEYDNQNDEIKLVRGHGYPDSSVDNGFDWEFDNTRPYEFDKECLNWEFYEIDNGIMLNCYPDKILFTNLELLKKIKEY